MPTSFHVRECRIDDIPAMLKVEAAAWPEGSRALPEMLESRILTYPEGQICAVLDETIVGHVSLERINLDPSNPGFSTWAEITDNGYIRGTHKPQGNCCYGVNMSGVPTEAGRVGYALLEKAKMRVTTDNISLASLGSRLPGLSRAGIADAEAYAFSKRKNGRFLDPELELIRMVFPGIQVIKVLPDYFPCEESRNFGALMVWRNPACTT